MAKNSQMMESVANNNIIVNLWNKKPTQLVNILNFPFVSADGFTTIIYDMARKEDMPAITSVDTFVLAELIPKKVFILISDAGSRKSEIWSLK